MNEFTKTASIVGSWHTECKSTTGSKSGRGNFRSTTNDGDEKWPGGPKLMLLLVNDRFDASPFSELSDNNDESIETESLSSTGISNFGIGLMM